jgi:hypothetical protein
LRGILLFLKHNLLSWRASGLSARALVCFLTSVEDAHVYVNTQDQQDRAAPEPAARGGAAAGRAAATAKAHGAGAFTRVFVGNVWLVLDLSIFISVPSHCVTFVRLLSQGMLSPCARLQFLHALKRHGLCYSD